MAQAVAREAVSGTASAPKKRKPFLLDLYSTAVGKKYVMAITGHRPGLRVRPHGRQPEDVLRPGGRHRLYAEWLRELLVPFLPRTVALWVMRIGLIVALVLHLHAAYTLTLINRRARPVRYQSRATTSPPTSPAARCAGRASSSCSSSSGTSPTSRGAGQPRLHPRRGVPERRRQPLPLPVAILYIVANIALGIHLFHGAWSLFQTMGWNNPASTCGAAWSRHGARRRRSSSATCRSRSPSRPASSRSDAR